jgi:Fe-S-cluster containining protein
MPNHDKKDHLYDEYLQWARSNPKTIAEKIKKLRRLKTKEAENKILDLHHDAFAEINCMLCARCCKAPGPRLLTADVDRLAKSLKMKGPAFRHQYTRVDEDGDTVFRTLPCPFLGTDLYCFVYDVRPRACREYPHTNVQGTITRFPLHLKNAAICPAVAYIFRKLDL